ncbi:hypothetical protein [Pontitalea aquivivens]|uniref:hypothetical protein n=1 Tax=Pontitalea aquivivens TaxID=3388663 RepID=UPI0039706675
MPFHSKVPLPSGTGNFSDYPGATPGDADLAGLRPIRAVLGREDYWRLNAHRRRCEALGGPLFLRLARLIRAKMLDATVAEPDAMDPLVVTGTARVTFAIDKGRPETRVLYHWGYSDRARNRLHVGTFLGVTLIGMTVGQRMRLLNASGVAGELQVLAVQPADGPNDPPSA